MATIYLTLSVKTDTNPHKEVRIRFKHGTIDQQAKTNIFVPAEYWNKEAQQVIVPNFRLMTDERKELKNYLTEQNGKLSAMAAHVHAAFNSMDKSDVPPDWLKNLIDRYNFPERYAKKVSKTFFDIFDDFLRLYPLTETRRGHFATIKMTFARYEIYARQTTRDFSLSKDAFTAETLHDFAEFLKEEHSIYAQNRDSYSGYVSRKPLPRSQNTIIDILKKTRTFFIWACKNGKMSNNPFTVYSLEECVYGTPYYITVKERNQLHLHDFSDDRELETQRDIFVFQCLVGCRVGDLFKLAKSNIIGGAVEYIARKTKDGNPVTVRVPLNTTAKGIIAKYAGCEGDALLPYTTVGKYNDDIKKMFAAAGLTRSVTVLDPLTRENVIRPLNEIASSHIARRCFVGNLYKQVKDPALVGALSGHKEGSKAFARYREIDEDMKKELVTLLE